MVTVNWCCWWGLLDWIDYIQGVGERFLSKFDPKPVLSSGDGAYLEVACRCAALSHVEWEGEKTSSDKVKTVVAFGHPYPPYPPYPQKSIPFFEFDISEVTRNTDLNISHMSIIVRIPH